MVAVFRVLQVFRGHDTDFVSHELLIMGGLSLTVAAIQMMAAHSYKRLVAYACVSSSGVIAIGLSVGKLADFVVLERDPYQVPADELKDIRVLRTVVGGATVHLVE